MPVGTQLGGGNWGATRRQVVAFPINYLPASLHYTAHIAPAWFSRSSAQANSYLVLLPV